MKKQPTHTRFVVVPENRAAWSAVQRLVDAIQSGHHGDHRILLLHGPGGTGKTHLALSLVRDVTRADPGTLVQHLGANDWKVFGQKPQADESAPESEAGSPWLADARDADVTLIEDVQHLPRRAANSLVELLDARHGEGLPTLITSRLGPRQLAAGLPARLTSRLAAGLVVGLDALGRASRRQLLEHFAQRQQVAVAADILDWLAEQLTGGGHQLQGAVAQLDTLTKMQRQPLRLAEVRPHFEAQLATLRPSVERIVRQVGGHFHLAPEELMSRRRTRTIVVPRQIGMYLVRELTQLSFKRIGACFGGHDHSTVLHACRKVEHDLKTDPLLSGAVKQLHAELA